MPLPEWLLWYLPAIFLFQLLIVWYVIKRSGRAGETTRGTPVERESITCPRCETENQASYRFCRSCVEELPRDGLGKGSASTSPQKWIR